MNIVFAGTPVFSAIHLQALLDSPHRVVAVYTQPDRPAGRGKKLTPSPVKVIATQAQVPLQQPDSLKLREEQAILAEFRADVMVVVAYGLILPEDVLKIPHFGCINVHASILPRWRGAAPIQRAIEAGDPASGITIMQMDRGLDTGAVLHQVACPIGPNDTASDLHDRLADIGPKALLHCLQQLQEGALEPRTQDDTQSCYAAKLTKDEARIDWQMSSRELHNKIRAYHPFPMCHSSLDGERIRILRASLVNKQSSQLPAGQLLQVDKSGLLVACGKGVLNLLQVQLSGKKPMSAGDAINGFGHLFATGKRFI